MLPALGDHRHDLTLGQWLFELNAEAIALDPANDTGQFETLTFEQEATANRGRGRGAEHGAALRYVEQDAIGLAVHRKKGGSEHDAVASVPTPLDILFLTGKCHRAVLPRITLPPISRASPIITNES